MIPEGMTVLGMLIRLDDAKLSYGTESEFLEASLNS